MTIKMIDHSVLYKSGSLEIPCFCGELITTFRYVPFRISLTKTHEEMDIYCRHCRQSSRLIKCKFGNKNYVLFNMSNIDTDIWATHVIQNPELLMYTPDEYKSIEILLMEKLS